MSTPVCPACGGTNVSPDPTNGGAGRNVCRCGHRAPVRDFHQPREFTMPLTRGRNKFEAAPASRYEPARTRPAPKAPNKAPMPVQGHFWWQE